MNVAVRTETARESISERLSAQVRRVAANADARAIAGLLLLFALLAGLSWRAWGVPSVDAGHELNVANTLASGGQPYGDIRYFYGPVGLYALGGAFAVFGASFTTAFAFGLLQAAAIIAAFYALARQLLSVVPAAIATAIVAAIGFSGTAFNFVLPHTNSATFGILFLLLMLLALKRERLVLAGLAAGVVGLTRPEFVAVAALAGLAYLVGVARQHGVRTALRALAPLALPAVLLAGGVLALLASSVGAERLFAENLWPVDFLRIAGFNSQHSWAPRDLESLAATVARAGVYCTMLAAVIAAALLYSHAESLKGRLLALWPLPAAAIALLVVDAAWKATGIWAPAQAAVQSEATHLLIGMSWLPALGFAACVVVGVRLLRGGDPLISDSWGFDLALVVAAAALGARAYDAFTAEASYAPYYAAPLVLLLAVLHDRLSRRFPEARTALYAALAAVAIGLAAYAQVALYPDDSAAVHTQRGSFLTTPASAPVLQETIDYVDSHVPAGEPLLAVPSDSGLDFMTDRTAPLYDAMFLPGLLDSRQDEREAIARLEAEHVRYAVIENRRYVGYRYELFGIDYNRMFARWIRRNGAPVATFGDTKAERPGGTNPPTSFEIYRIDQ
ncbi:MAG TPA: glycosyltransferase family 39 protein [Solirubrobacterales bacterium]|nr:glycosyltransferase family 39 protein [Solirubrobacterales bacterium]